MFAGRSRQGVPDLVTGYYGVLVAIFSGVSGIVGHGITMGSGGRTDPGTVVSALLLASLAGGLTTVLSRRGGDALVTAAGLALGQVAVHLGLSAHPRPPEMAATAGGMHLHATPLAGIADGGPSALWSSTMLLAHLTASAVALVLLLATGRAMSWIAARITVATRNPRLRGGPYAPVPEAVSPPVLDRYWFSVGGTRAPPCVV